MRWDKEKLSKSDSHVYGKNGAKIMVYNMKRNPKKEKTEKKKKKKSLRNIIVKGKTLDY